MVGKKYCIKLDTVSLTVLAVLLFAGCYLGGVPEDPDLVITPPSNVTAAAESSGNISLSWSSVSNASSYIIYRAASSYGTYKYISSVSSSYTSYTDTDTDLTLNTTYYYQVTAVNRNGKESSRSTTAIALSVTATRQSSSSISLSWSSVSGASSYRIYRAASSSGPYTRIDSYISSSSTSYTDNYLSLNTTYYYQVAAVNSNGNEISRSTTAQATTTLSAPTGVTATRYSSNISLSWSSVSGASYYKIYRATSSSGTYSSISSYTSSTSYTDSNNLTSSNYYYYKVTAVDSSGNESSRSDYASVYYY